MNRPKFAYFLRRDFNQSSNCLSEMSMGFIVLAISDARIDGSIPFNVCTSKAAQFGVFVPVAVRRFHAGKRYDCIRHGLRRDGSVTGTVLNAVSL